ncbi:hypothetical protein BD414DRAFT_434731 [Trametes punicea]|nr:hypothetical protein BD414DRAFT_434731 [Trametes punicea]
MEPLTRTEILRILQSMGIELPQNTKIPDDTLEKRLRAALDAAQEKSRFPSQLKPLELAPWPLAKADELNSRARPLLDAVKRGNWQEALANYMRGRGACAAPELYVDPFMDLRQTVMSLANVLDQGLTWCTVQDPEREKHAINIRFLHVLELDEKTPAIVLLYRPFSQQNAIEGARWCQLQVEKNPRNVGGVGANVTATLLEQKLLLKLLSMNARLLPPDFKFEKQQYEEHYRASVLLPVGPLGFEAIGKLNSNTGCATCGEHAGRRCGQCQSVSYCSPECQRADWPSHKPTCQAIKGGRWVKVPFRAAVPGMEGMHAALINRFTNMTRPEDVLSAVSPGDPSVPFPNVHGERLFLVKMQVGLAGAARDTIMVYDQQRSFGNVYVAREDGPALFSDLVGEMAGPRGGYGGVKMYRWANRTGDRELSVCVDRRPETVTKW